MFFTKYATISGWFIYLVALFLHDIIYDRAIDPELYLVILLPIGLLFILCQICFSWVFPHNVTIYDNRIVAVGPWKISHTISFDKIRTILCNKQSTVIQKKYGINKIIIGKSIDPQGNIQEILIHISQENPGIRLVENAYI